MTLKVYSPFDRSEIGEVPLNSADDIEKMLQTAHNFYKDYDNWLSKNQRIDILDKLAELLEGEKEERAVQIAREGGKPLVDARVEADRVIEGIRLAIKELEDESAEEIPMGLNKASEGRKATSVREPIGVVVALSAFNHPLNLIIHQVVPAVAVGCPVIVKPASATPFSCVRVVELLKAAGLPDGWCQLVICNNELAEKLATDARVGFLSFIGSAKVGWMLRSRLAQGTRCGFEHGGVAPVIFDETADIAKAVPVLVKGGFYHAGQVCVSVQKIFAHQSVARELAEKLAESANKLKVGNPVEEDTDVGPLITPEEVNRVDEWVKESGAEILCGGEKLSATTFAPTVLFNPADKVKLSTEEVFAPVVCVYEYADRVQAIRKANSLPYAFQAAVFTKDKKVAEDTVNRLDATAVMVNDHTAFRVDWMPFGGRRQSGLGLGGIGYTMHDMTQIKMKVEKIDD